MVRFITALALACAASAAIPGWDTLEWTTPTSEPSKNRANQPIIGGGMPIGNGDTVALVFPNTKTQTITKDFSLPTGVSFFVNMATAMASDTALMGLGMVSIMTKPNLFDGSTDFRQTLYLRNASVSVSTSKGTVRVWVDANTNAIHADVDAPMPVVVTVEVQSLHPDKNFTYGGNFGFNNDPAWASMCTPDRFGPPSKDTLYITHRNLDSDSPKAFNQTLLQQGLSHLIDSMQSADHWRHRQFGMSVMGANASDFATSGLTTLVTKSPTRNVAIWITTHAAQTSTEDEWYAQLHSKNAKRYSIETANSEHADWWTAFWGRSHIQVTGASSASATADEDARILTNQYARTRYLQAIQSRTWVPIKFNGLMFQAQLPPETVNSGPTFRSWGASSWWQNTRLPYWAMAPAGDFDTFQQVFEFYLQTVPLLSARTQAYFNHTGIFYTETKTLFGLFTPGDYGHAASDRTPGSGLPPVYLEENGYIHYDRGGNAGGTEVSLMILDHYLYTQDAGALKRYMPIVTLTLDFFRQHYRNRTADGKYIIWPTQALETYWCAFSNPWVAPNEHNCIEDDHPTVSALHVLLEKVLALPTQFSTAEQRAQWVEFQSKLPPVPITTEDGLRVVSPYGSYPKNNGIHNSETPELYSTHPFRYFTLGRSALGGRDINPSLVCLNQTSKRQTCKNGASNDGWNQGILNAALLGEAAIAHNMIVERARTSPAVGYRFPAFAPHEQDYEPSADHFANMNSALNWMILQPADDSAGSAILFGAWPCHWDVEFKLLAPMNTVVEGSLKDGKLASLKVTPVSRTSNIKVMRCAKI
eukprot:NODE_332_length_2657_cov_50.772691_g312_i0.p1 GENE.NODE_332_length_2657_cov_50.772691_g312_i0~~NODE_332_length_2657_cov_50.772691_g312_i0.p1  ORF type:complete len:832 (-),score=157.15 NODE_332_length_2657_cov_50.772691_g312_i0:160-2604(-)